MQQGRVERGNLGAARVDLQTEQVALYHCRHSRRFNLLVLGQA